MFLSLFALLSATPASAASMDDHTLGAYYELHEVSDAVVHDAAEAVVHFPRATGFLVSADGYILTNHHVYQSFGESGVVTREWSGETYAERLQVELIVTDPDWDMALYRVTSQRSDLPYIPLRPAAPEVGESVFLVGHPHGWGQRVSFGEVLANDIVVGGNPSVEYSAQTWWGSSGSPVLDAQGRAIALHWGWDSTGISNGRLTGIPIHKMAAAIPEVGRLVEQPSTRVASGRCLTSEAWALRTVQTAEASSVNSGGRSLDTVRVSAESPLASCMDELLSVTYRLHPTFARPVVSVKADQHGAPLTLHTWGHFKAVAVVETRSGTVQIEDWVRW